jgi:hypothetical protein
MLTVLVGEVLASFVVPVQLPTVKPASGDAVRVMVSPAMYCPAAQSVEFNGLAVGTLPPVVEERVSM